MRNDYYVVSKEGLNSSTQALLSDDFKLDPLDYAQCVSGITKNDVVKALKIETFDTAIPQTLVDDIIEKTGYDICRHAVYDYSVNQHGSLHPITREGVVIIKIYQHIA